MKTIDSLYQLITNPENKKELLEKLRTKLESGIFHHLINQEKYGLVVEIDIKVLEKDDN